jgi:hypothetical protein
MESLTAIPASMIMPMKDMIFRGSLRITSSPTAPTIARGMVRRITKGWRRDSNWEAITI